jgi:hypothetical protein
MTLCYQYASFLIRMWRQTVKDGCFLPFQWSSEVEHIQTGELWSFNRLDEFLAFLSNHIREQHELTWIEIQEKGGDRD